MTHRDLDSILRHAVILGALAVLLVPAARGSSQWFGWLPLWRRGGACAGSRYRRWRCGCRGGVARRRAGGSRVALRRRCRGPAGPDLRRFGRPAPVLAFRVHRPARSPPLSHFSIA